MRFSMAGSPRLRALQTSESIIAMRPCDTAIGRRCASLAGVAFGVAARAPLTGFGSHAHRKATTRPLQAQQFRSDPSARGLPGGGHARRRAYENRCPERAHLLSRGVDILHRQRLPDELCPGFQVSTDKSGNLSVLQIAVPAHLSLVVGHGGIFHRDGVRRVAAPIAAGRLQCDLSVRIGLATLHPSL